MFHFSIKQESSLASNDFHSERNTFLLNKNEKGFSTFHHWSLSLFLWSICVCTCVHMCVHRFVCTFVFLDYCPWILALSQVSTRIFCPCIPPPCLAMTFGFYTKLNSLGWRWLQDISGLLERRRVAWESRPPCDLLPHCLSYFSCHWHPKLKAEWFIQLRV